MSIIFVLIYLDYNATTPCAPEVVEAMLPYFTDKFGNAGSVTHSLGWVAQDVVKQSRQKIADYLSCDPEELVFTSGATESCNLAIQGVFNAYQIKGKEIICSSTEHKAVLDTYAYLEKLGAIVHILPVDALGQIQLEELEKLLNANTLLVSIMYANNETGTIADIAAIGELCRKHQVLFFCDATQAVGKIPINMQELPIDAMAFSGHKLYGPKGIGVLYLRRKKPRVQVIPLLHGGGQEKERRSGTLNVPGIVGLAKAIELAVDTSWIVAVTKWRNEIEHSILELDSNFSINGDTNNRLGHVSSIALTGVKAERLLSKVNHVLCFSLGSACAAALQGPSHVLQAMYASRERIDGSVRISLGRYTTADEIKVTIETLKYSIQNLKTIQL